MKHSLIALALLIAVVMLAGCTQSQPAMAPQPEATPVPAQQPATPDAAVTPAASPAATSIPVQTVTVIRYVAADKRWKDTSLRIAFTTPDDWAVTSHQIDSEEGTQGLEFQTSLKPDNTFYIITFPISRNQDQDYRNAFRKWIPVPAESTVTIGNVVFDRFESTFNKKTQVGYVARKSSANDLGYSSVIYFIADDSVPYQKDDFEKVVQSFVYLNKENAQTSAATEIPLIR